MGKTSLSCASAIRLADEGKRVLLVSTDPASNLDEVLRGHPLAGPGTRRCEGTESAARVTVNPGYSVFREPFVEFVHRPDASDLESNS